MNRPIYFESGNVHVAGMDKRDFTYYGIVCVGYSLVIGEHGHYPHSFGWSAYNIINNGFGTLFI